MKFVLLNSAPKLLMQKKSHKFTYDPNRTKKPNLKNIILHITQLYEKNEYIKRTKNKYIKSQITQVGITH